MNVYECSMLSDIDQETKLSGSSTYGIDSRSL